MLCRYTAPFKVIQLETIDHFTGHQAGNCKMVYYFACVTDILPQIKRAEF